MKKLDVLGFSFGFKPCYKWNTFNTEWTKCKLSEHRVLNLVISGIPSILKNAGFSTHFGIAAVLNLVISGIPSIQMTKNLS